MNKQSAKKLFFYSLIVFLVLLFAIFALKYTFFQEDTWIKDSRGVYIKHGNPSATPQEVKDQQAIINGAIELYKSKKMAGMVFSSQCLGAIQEHAIDIVHVPRIKEDEHRDNQCLDFIQGRVIHFVELDKEGNIVRIV